MLIRTLVLARARNVCVHPPPKKLTQAPCAILCAPVRSCALLCDPVLRPAWRQHPCRGRGRPVLHENRDTDHLPDGARQRGRARGRWDRRYTDFRHQFDSPFFARVHQCRLHRAVSRGLHHVARCFVLIGLLSAPVVSNWGVRPALNSGRLGADPPPQGPRRLHPHRQPQPRRARGGLWGQVRWPRLHYCTLRWHHLPACGTVCALGHVSMGVDTLPLRRSVRATSNLMLSQTRSSCSGTTLRTAGRRPSRSPRRFMS